MQLNKIALRKIISNEKKFFVIVSIILISCFDGCSGLEVLSKWQESSLLIDGSKQDWGNNLQFIEDAGVLLVSQMTIKICTYVLLFPEMKK